MVVVMAVLERSGLVQKWGGWQLAVVLLVVVMAMVMVMAVGGRDGGGGGTPHRENVPTHSASLVGRTPAWANNLLDWIGVD